MKRGTVATRLFCLWVTAAGCTTLPSVASATESNYRLPVDTGPVRAVREIGGMIWIGADNGLFFWDSGANALRQIPSVDRVYAISGSQAKIWVASKAALLIMRPGGGEPAHLPIDTGQVFTLYTSGETLWMGGERGLFRWQEGTAGPELVPWLTGRITAILESPAALWVGSLDGLFCLAPGARVARKFSTEIGPVGGLHRIPGGIWIDAENGQFWWRDGEKEPSRITAGTGVVFVIREVGARLLIGAEKGLFEWTRGTSEPAGIAFPGIPVTGISATARGALVGTREGVFFWDKDTRRPQPLPFTTGAVNGIYRTTTKYWISAEDGLYRIGESDLARVGSRAISPRWIISLAIFAAVLCLAAYWILFRTPPSLTVTSAGAIPPLVPSKLRETTAQFIGGRRSKLASLRLPTAGLVKLPAAHLALQSIEGSPAAEKLCRSIPSANQTRGVALPELQIFGTSVKSSEQRPGITVATLEPNTPPARILTALGSPFEHHVCQIPDLVIREWAGLKLCEPAEECPALSTVPAVPAGPRLDTPASWFDGIWLPEIQSPVQPNAAGDGHDRASEPTPVVAAGVAAGPKWHKPEMTPAWPPLSACFSLFDWSAYQILGPIVRHRSRSIGGVIRRLRIRIPSFRISPPREAPPYRKMLLVPVAILEDVFLGEGLANLRRLVDGQRAAWGSRIRARAPVHLDSSLRPPFLEWQGPPGWEKTWVAHSEGGTQPGRLALLGRSIPLVDYQFEFLVELGRGGVGWAVRGRDTRNHYALRMEIEQPGPRPVVSLVRYPVISGQPGVVSTTPFQTVVQAGSPSRVRTDVQGTTFTVHLDGHLVSSWTDNHFGSGGVGFFSDRRDPGKVYWMKLSSHDDLVGGLCAWLAPTEAGAGRTAESEANK